MAACPFTLVIPSQPAGGHRTGILSLMPVPALEWRELLPTKSVFRKLCQAILAFKKCSKVIIMRSDIRVGWDNCFDFVGTKSNYQIYTAFFIFLIFQSVDNPSNFVLTKWNSSLIIFFATQAAQEVTLSISSPVCLSLPQFLKWSIV